MKKAVLFLLTALLLCALTACGGSQAAAKGVASNTTTVAQIMEDAGQQPEAPAENAVEPPLPAEMEPVAQQPRVAPGAA